MNWIFNLIGIVIYFLLRYNGRTDQTTKLSIGYWFKDNWPEFLGILLFNILLMLLFVVGGVTIDLEKFIPSLPNGVAFVGDAAICALIGLVLAHGVYELFKAKVKK
jgi:hypothetical protein